MRLKTLGLCFGLILLASRAHAATITYILPDINTSPDYIDFNTALTFSGDGFSGMYGGAAGFDAWAHLFGVEQTDFSRTIGQVDVSALAGTNITSAVFSFDLVNGSSGSQTLTFGYFSEDGTLSYNFSPTLDGSTTFASTGQGSNAVDVTALLSAFLTGGGGNWFGFFLQGSSEFQWTYTYTGFGAGPDSANVRLTVEYQEVPEPAALSLFGVALAVSCGALRRRIAARRA